MNLGDKLKAANEARAREKSQAEIRKREEETRKYVTETREILSFLDGCKANFIASIEEGVTPKTYKVPKSSKYGTYSWNGNSIGTFKETNHPHYNAFQSFFDWAAENGLVGCFYSCHDGGGYDSWYEVGIKVKED